METRSESAGRQSIPLSGAAATQEASPDTRRMAETVVALDEYLSELKAQALWAEEVVEIARRGYLKPGEEMALRQLQLSYWKSRNALFEIVAARPEETMPDRQGWADFLVAMAAAVLLVDAGRFLREQYHRVAPIRQKLNEPDAVNEIPDRMYHRVQRSLTSPTHAWQLHHARRTYHKLRPQLVEQFADPPWTDLLKVIHRHQHRLRPSVWGYLRTRFCVRGRQFAHCVGGDLAGQALYRLQRYVSSLLADITVNPSHEPGLSRMVRDSIVKQIQPGDVFVTRKEYAATNYFLPGYWPHAALYLGAPQPVETSVLEAMKDGVRRRPVDSPLASDSVVVLRPMLDPAEIHTALDRAMTHEGKPYDFDFDFSRSDRLVCTEVVYRAYDGVGPMQFNLERHVGRLALGADAIIRGTLAGRNFRPLLVYSPDDDSEIVVGAGAEQILRTHCSQ